MKILVTGAKGFIGRNLITELRNRSYNQILEYDRDTDATLLEQYCKETDFVFHLAGVNRPTEQSEFMEGNYIFTKTILDLLKRYSNNCPVLITSSIQAELDNPYGKSKKALEEAAFAHGKELGAKVLIYRFPNVFGKWCKPNYNSAIATFCHNIARGLSIRVDDSSASMKLVYINDVVDEMINALEGKANKVNTFCEVPLIYTRNLGQIVDLLYSFKNSREDLSVPNVADDFTKKLYSTYLSYLPEDEFSYKLKMNVDQRGSFTEFIKTSEQGQVSVNISKPGIVKGNHWHHTKNEKFLVVSGQGIVRFRGVNSQEVLEYFVSGEVMEVIDIPTGYTHNIENIGNSDLVTIMWANERYDPEKPDTYYLEV